MGASGWDYFVPYQQNVERALHDLREQIFLSGAYFLRPPMEINPDDFADMPEEVRAQVPVWIEREESFSEPTTLEALIEWNGEEGTHSIIDIERISPIPSFCAAAPLSSEQLIAIFGTDKPEQKMVEQKRHEIQGIRDRWEATYIIIYENGKPDEIFFAGFSGD
jgi:hypothetical protein